MLATEFQARATGRMLRGTEGRTDDETYRGELLEWLEQVHNEVRCEHSPEEGYHLVDAVLSLTEPGPVVECGVFHGGMTVKLSRACRDTARELFVCDSYEGLPDVPSNCEEYEHYPQRVDVLEAFGESVPFPEGDYSCELSKVVEHVKRFGALEVCRFIVGFFDKTLPTLNVEPQLVMVDVDLIESGRDCLKWLWPSLQGDRFFTHEAFNKTYMRGIQDPEWWHEVMREEVPLVEGDVYGLHEQASCLACLWK